MDDTARDILRVGGGVLWGVLAALGWALFAFSIVVWLKEPKRGLFVLSPVLLGALSVLVGSLTLFLAAAALLVAVVLYGRHLWGIRLSIEDGVNNVLAGVFGIGAGSGNFGARFSWRGLQLVGVTFRPGVSKSKPGSDEDIEAHLAKHLPVTTGDTRWLVDFDTNSWFGSARLVAATPSVIPFRLPVDPEKVYMGEGARGGVFWVPGRDAHVLGCGETGGGKTSLLYALLLHFLSLPGCYQVVVLDPKGSGFPPLKGFENVLGRESEAVKCLEILKEFEVEMDRRKAKFARLSERDGKWIKDIETYNSTYKGFLLRWVALGDEVAELMASISTSDSKKKNDEELAAKVEISRVSQRIARLGRAYGIHLVFAVQRAPADVIDTTTRGQFGLRVACGRLDPGGSEMLFGDTRGSDFVPLRRGHWFASGSAWSGDFQGVFASEKDLDLVRAWLQAGQDYDENMLG